MHDQCAALARCPALVTPSVTKFIVIVTRHDEYVELCSSSDDGAPAEACSLRPPTSARSSLISSHFFPIVKSGECNEALEASIQSRQEKEAAERKRVREKKAKKESSAQATKSTQLRSSDARASNAFCYVTLYKFNMFLSRQMT